MSKHTPGPWVWDEDGAALRAPGKRIVLRDGEGIWNLWNNPSLKGGMGEANARLIAAAPDLLEALQRVLRHIPAEAGGASLSDDVHRAQKAIAKAIKGHE